MKTIYYKTLIFAIANGRKGGYLLSTLEKLIDEGENLKNELKLNDWGGKVLEGEDLERWCAKSVLYMDEYSVNEFLSEKVKENARDLSDNGYKKYIAILGILKAIYEYH